MIFEGGGTQYYFYTSLWDLEISSKLKDKTSSFNDDNRKLAEMMRKQKRKSCACLAQHESFQLLWQKKGQGLWD